MSFPARLVFPEPAPSVCVTFFTEVAGTADLEHTYAAAVGYLEAQRSADAIGERLRYELVWVDNGGSAEAHAALIGGRGAQFEIAQHNPTNEGLFRAVNDVWFRGRGCRAPPRAGQRNAQRRPAAPRNCRWAGRRRRRGARGRPTSSMC